MSAVRRCGCSGASKSWRSAWKRVVRTHRTAYGAIQRLALSPACVELYGVTAYGEARRTNEIGIRMVLGVDNGNVLGLELRAAPARLALGLAIGIPAALA